MSMDFITAVNRILRVNGLIRGDTDTLVTFNDQSHNSSSSLAQIAIQDEISELTGKGLIPAQFSSNTITLVTGTRTYTLPSDYIKLVGDPPFFLDTTQNIQIYEYPGGENQLRIDIYDYRTQSGNPVYFYFETSSAAKVSFFQVPDAGANGRAFTYDYYASENVSASTDPLPLDTVDQQYAFCAMAGRRFKFLFEGKIDVPVDSDAVYREARARLFNLLGRKKAGTHYGKVYMSPQDMGFWQ